MKHFHYLSYVLRHKFFVFVECCKLGIPWLGFIHDWSKFRPSEWFPYVEHFYGKGKGIKEGRDETGYYQAGTTGDLPFDFAWLLHQKITSVVVRGSGTSSVWPGTGGVGSPLWHGQPQSEYRQLSHERVRHHPE